MSDDTQMLWDSVAEKNAEIEKLRLRRHELNSLREMIVYARSIAQTFPDTGGSTFAAGLRAHAQIIEDMLERIETEKGKTDVSD